LMQKPTLTVLQLMSLTSLHRSSMMPTGTMHVAAPWGEEDRRQARLGTCFGSGINVF
jgi:hypothetical protein